MNGIARRRGVKTNLIVEYEKTDSPEKTREKKSKSRKKLGPQNILHP